MDSSTLAAAEGARRRIKRASGLIRDALRDLGSLTDDADAFAVVTCHDEPTRVEAERLIALGVARYGAVEVVVLRRPTRKPTRAADAAKEQNQNGNANQTETGRQRQQHVGRV